MTQSLCFDVDGTVINSRELVTKAYANVGVTLPDGVWGQPWQDWLIDYCGSESLAREIHKQKVNEYADLLLRTDLRQYELPAARLARTWLTQYGVPFVTYLTAGAAETAFSIVSRLAAASRLHGELSYHDRVTRLHELPRGTIYLDDNVDTLSRLTVDAPHLHLIAITGQSYDKLAELVREVRDRAR